MKELGLAWTEGNGQMLAERLLLPSLTIRGLSSGGTGEYARNVIPSTATAAIRPVSDLGGAPPAPAVAR